MSRGLQIRKCLFWGFACQLQVRRIRTEFDFFAPKNGSILCDPYVFPLLIILPKPEHTLTSKMKIHFSFFTVGITDPDVVVRKGFDLQRLKQRCSVSRTRQSTQ
jgi:hypothetical protein